jgi:hypothetical protein
MKKILNIILLQCFVFAALAQPPEKMNYQAVLRNSSNELIVNQEVTIKISILQNAADGIIVYNETQSVTTNSNGLVTLEIGNETGFSNINWANANYYIQIEADPEGGTNFTISGVSQLLSVPYALHAKTTSQTVTETDPVYSASDAATISSSNISNWNNAFGWGNHATAGYLTAFTENDPVFTSHISYGINSTDTEQWDSAYSWGNHAEMGYLTSVSAESDPIFGASAASGISSTNISNWNAAYGWGNHATQGYLTSFSETDPYSVHLIGSQTISGEKTFTNTRTYFTQVELNAHNSGNRNAYIDFHGDDTHTDYSLRLIRTNEGANGNSWLNHRGTGGLYLSADDAGKIILRTAGLNRLFVDSNGEIGVGTTSPGAKFEVNSAGYTGDVLFQVKDNAGNPVFTVYPDAVEVSVPETGTKANKHGSFTVTGRSTKDDKATTPITRITKQNYLIGHNVAVGITGTKNNVFGYEAGKSLTSGSNNVLIGFEAGYSTNASYTVLIGNNAGKTSTGSYNVAIGNDAGSYMGTATRNTMVGDVSGGGAVGSNVAYYGYWSGVNSSGDYCTYIGSQSGRLIYGAGNTYLGYRSGYNTTSSAKNATNNVFLGYQTGYNSYGTGNVFIGPNVGQSRGVNNQLWIDNSNTSDPLIYGDFSGNEVEINGRLGINKNPSNSYGLDVNGATQSASFTSTGGSYYGAAATLGYISMPSTGEFIYKRNGVSSLVVSSNYDVGVGVSSPTYRLQVYDQVGNSSASGYISYFFNDVNSTGARGFLMQAGPDAGSYSGNGYYMSIRDGNGDFVGNIYSSNGSLQIAAKSPSKGKSIIQKSNKNAIDIIEKLKIVDYKFNSEAPLFTTGFIGEDVIKVFPQMVDFDEEAGEFTISNSALIPILTKALQEQQEKIDEIDELKKEIAGLKQIINQLTKE